MTRQRRLIFAISFSLLAVHAGGRLQAVEGLLRGSALSKSDKFKSVVAVPVVHHIGFWSHNHDFAVSALYVTQREGMTASRPEATIRIAVEGRLKKGRRIKELYVREQLRDVANGKRVVEIILIPVIEAETASPDASEQTDVRAATEYTLHQFQWPDNDFVITCGRHVKELQYRYL